MNIQVKDICKTYKSGKKNVLKSVGFTAKSGQCIGILGCNGCGKTTLLSILAGVLKADSGEFMVDDVDLLKNYRLINKNVGYVPQGNPLIEELSAKDNLKLWYSDSILDMNKELESGVLKMLKITDFLNVRVSRMSGGMKKRLSIGCAVANNPAILIMDEPGAGLDIECKEQITEYLNDYKSKGGIVFITSHEEREIALCDKIYILKEGVIKEHDFVSIEELVKEM